MGRCSKETATTSCIVSLPGCIPGTIDETPKCYLLQVFIRDTYLISTVCAGSSSSFLPVLGTTILSWPFSSLASTWLGSTLSGSCRAGGGEWGQIGSVKGQQSMHWGLLPACCLSRLRSAEQSSGALLSCSKALGECHSWATRVRGKGGHDTAEPQPQPLQPRLKGGG